MFENTQLEPDLSISYLLSTDIAPIKNILDAFPLEFSENDKQHFHQGLDEFVKKDANASSTKIVVLRQDNEAIGCVTYYPDPESDTYGYIGWIVIRKDLHSRGLGTKLMNIACSELKRLGLRYVTLKTVDTGYNAQVKQFYEKRGFQFVGVLPGYYLQPTERGIEEENCIMYFKEL